jgi:hypothetical protein
MGGGVGDQPVQTVFEEAPEAVQVASQKLHQRKFSQKTPRHRQNYFRRK